MAKLKCEVCGPTFIGRCPHRPRTWIEREFDDARAQNATIPNWLRAPKDRKETSLEQQRRDERKASDMADDLIAGYHPDMETKRQQLISALYRFLQENSEDA